MNIFGTDGVRGRANEEPMTATTLTKFGIVVGSLFLPETSRGKVIIGKDTRLSGYLIESAITAGLASADGLYTSRTDAYACYFSVDQRH